MSERHSVMPMNAAEIKSLSEARAKTEADQTPEKKPWDNFILVALYSNEDGDASLFRRIHKDRFIYDHAAVSWYTWAEHYWCEDRKGEAMAAISDVIDAYSEEADRQAWAATKATKEGKLFDAKDFEKIREDILKRIKKLQTANRKKNVLLLATAGDGLCGDEWDRDPWLLACKNGVIDLKTGEHRPGWPEDRIKTAAPTEWQGIEATCPTWERFLCEIFSSDQELIAYVQRLLGYGVTGLSILHILIILWGAGRNGKGTLLEALKSVLGDYAYKADSELLLEQRSPGSANAPKSGVLALRGKRLVWSSETDEGRKLNTSRVKEYTGGDTLNARAVYGRHHVEFEPSHLLLLMTNNRPQAPASDYALWKRVHLIPFTQSFVDNPEKPHEHKADPKLSQKLAAEAPGILAWLVRGCLEWQRQGLNPPETVMAATEAYRQEEDLIGHFIDDCCTHGPNMEVKAGELYKAYQEWCIENGHRPMSGTRFGKEIKSRYDWYRRSGYIYYIEMGLVHE